MRYIFFLLLFCSCAVEGPDCPPHIFSVWQVGEGFFWRTWIHLEVPEREYTLWLSCSRDSVADGSAAREIHEERDWGTYSITKTCDTTWVRLKTRLIDEINHD